ncbi:MAG: hypothetical protein WCC64_16050 [Aliidongia sp.]
MLAKRRMLKLNDQEIVRTPLLVPSFSSKGFPDVNKIVQYCSELIDGVMLVSAYDIHYKKLQPPFDFPSLIFLDSGGYEASKDAELSDFGDKEHIPKQWSEAMHATQLAKWQPNVPSVLISYDHPKERLPIKAQIERAKAMAPGREGLLREILLKPETSTQTLLQMRDIIKNVRALAEFDVIGVTEKELGKSVIDRMKNIAELRRALDKVAVETPIHVFGSLDTVTTPMYFLAGADIFDGLTWLRFAFHEGQTLYKQNYGALKYGVSTKSDVLNVQCMNGNYYYMKEMELEMRRFLNGNDFSVFKYHRELFQTALQSAVEAIGA